MSYNGNGSAGNGINDVGTEFSKEDAPESMNEWKFTKVKRKGSFVNFNSPDSVNFVFRDDNLEDCNIS